MYSLSYCNTHTVIAQSLILCTICHGNSDWPSITLKQTYIHKSGEKGDLTFQISCNVYSADNMHKPKVCC